MTLQQLAVVFSNKLIDGSSMECLHRTEDHIVTELPEASDRL